MTTELHSCVAYGFRACTSEYHRPSCPRRLAFIASRTPRDRVAVAVTGVVAAPAAAAAVFGDEGEDGVFD